MAYSYNFCYVAMVIRIYPAVISTEILCVTNKDIKILSAETSSLFEWPDGTIPFSDAAFQLLAYVTNATEKEDQTCSSYYAFSKTEYNTTALTICSICSLKTPKPKPFSFNNHEESLHMYIIYCILYARPIYAIFKKRILY